MSEGRGKKGRRKFTVDSLFQDTSPRAVGVRDLVDAKEINIDRIAPDPDQPRQTFDEEALVELAASIRQEGVLQPIAVRYDETEDHYIILHGERRWRAAQRAELTSIPAIVRDVPAERRLLHQLMENVVREDLNAVDRAAALRALKRQMEDAPWERVAEAVGIRRSRLFQLLSTEKLAEPVQEQIRSGALSEKQTRALQGLAPTAQVTLADMLVRGISDQQIREISRVLRDDPSHLELDDDALVSRIRGLQGTFQEPEETPKSKPDPLLGALQDLTGSRDLPEDPEQALQSISRRFMGSDVGESSLEEDLQRIGYQLGRLASNHSDQRIPPKQLRALKRLIDLALKTQRRR